MDTLTIHQSARQFINAGMMIIEIRQMVKSDDAFPFANIVSRMDHIFALVTAKWRNSRNREGERDSFVFLLRLIIRENY